MAETIQFKCPACGGNLEYSAERGRFVCPYCGSEYSEDELKAESAKREEEARKEDKRSDALREYHCDNCGASIVVGENTSATRCYYCHSPVVLSDRVNYEYRPDGMIPFAINEEKAREMFREYLKKRRFLDKRFFSEAQLECFSGVYYPYWMTDVDGTGMFDGEGHTSSSMMAKDVLITTTRYYRLQRTAEMGFSDIVRKGLKSVDRKLSDGIHPYDLKKMKKFASGYLSGFLAEKWDVTKDEAQEDSRQEAEGYVRSMITRNTDLAGLKGKTTFRTEEIRTKYVLLPAWVLTYHHEGKNKIYYYMMNGQNGKICGKLPLARGKLFAVALLVGAAVFALMCGGGAWIW